MGLYSKYILPKATHWACSQNPTMRQREKVIPLAYGKVLEIGIGSGLNLPFYDLTKIKHLIGIDPSLENWNVNRSSNRQNGLEVEFLQAYAENMPFDNKQFDTAVITYSLCSIGDPAASLEEIKRVLKPGGKLIFCEHGLAPDKNVRKWQKRLNPLWRSFSGGCNMNRNIPKLINEGGFKMNSLDTMYLPGWRVLNYNYWGTADIR
jgi:SAM-dependent methyltransferase